MTHSGGRGEGLGEAGETERERRGYSSSTDAVEAV